MCYLYLDRTMHVYLNLSFVPLYCEKGEGHFCKVITLKQNTGDHKALNYD